MDPYEQQAAQGPPPLRLGPLTPGQIMARDMIVGAAAASVIWFLIGAPGADAIADAFGWGEGE